MKEMLNDMTTVTSKFAELGDLLCLTTGYDKPKYLSPSTGQAGDLGFTPWTQFYYKPTYNSDVAGGTLDSSKFYAIKVVPVDSDLFGAIGYVTGTPSDHSTPRAPLGAGTNTIRFNIQDHPDTTVMDVGTTTEQGISYTVRDSSKTWVTNEWAGYTVRNVTTNTIHNITSNTDTDLIIDSEDSFTQTTGIMFPYQILKPKVNHYEIYAAEMNAESEVSAATWLYQGDVAYGDTTFDLSVFATGSALIADEYFPPENFAYCHQAYGRLFAGGGVDAEFDASVNMTVENRQATATADEDVVVSITTENYVGATNGRIVRYTLGSSLSAFTDAYVGSFVTVTNSGNSGNDIEDAQILRVADDKTWFEVENNEGVADASDVTMTIAMTPNVVETDLNIRYIRQGLVNGKLYLEGDASSYIILSVDTVNRRIMLTTKYTGKNTTTDVNTTVSTDYNLYYSDIDNPHVFRTANYIEISDKIKAFADFGGTMVVFCASSVWAVPLDNLGQRATKITDQVSFDAVKSVVTTPKGIAFWDGYGFSLVDGTSIISITKYRANEYLKGIDRDKTTRITGVYDRKNTRLEYAFPYGGNPYNDAGLVIQLDSLNCYGVTRPDTNVLWTDTNDDGDFKVYHGTSASQVNDEASAGIVWEHDEDLGLDVELDGYTNIIEITSKVNTSIFYGNTPSLGVLNALAGWPVVYNPIVSGGPIVHTTIRYLIEEEVTPRPYYKISTAVAIPDAQVGDQLIIGGIPFDYGVKWLDFGSPQYKHKVREIKIDTNDYTGILYVDHYLNSEDTPIKTDVAYLTEEDTHYSIPFRGGDGYTYGFRLRGISFTKMKLLSMSILFDTEV